MPRDDDTLDEQPHRLTHVIYNSALGHVRVRAEDGLMTTVEVPSDDVRFRRVVGAAEPEVALWLDSVERNYLNRMLEHVLRALRITPEARVALDAVRGKLEGLGPPPIVASEGNLGGPMEGAAPILEEPSAAPPPRAARPPAPPTPDADLPADSPAVSDSRSYRGRGGRRGETVDPEHAARAQPGGPPEPAPAAPSPADDVGLSQEPREPGTSPLRRRASARPGPAPDPQPASDGVPTHRDTPADSLSGAAEAVGEPVTFETVWHDLTTLKGRGPALHALAGQASSEIREVVDDGVWLYSHGLGREYLIGRDLLEVAWAVLVEHGVLVPRELRGAMSYGAATLLAHLPYVEYSADPITLYYPALALHALGTVRRRDI